MADPTVEFPSDTGGAEPRPAEVSRITAYEIYADKRYYLNAWESLLSTNRGGFKFNWPAALFGLSWCFYRKMYVLGVALVVAVFIVALVFGVVLGLIAPGEDHLGSVDEAFLAYVAIAIVRVPFGFVANRFYFRKATQHIEKSYKAGLKGPDLLEHLQRVGGTSPVALAVAIAITIAIRLLKL